MFVKSALNFASVLLFAFCCSGLRNKECISSTLSFHSKSSQKNQIYEEEEFEEKNVSKCTQKVVNQYTDGSGYERLLTFDDNITNFEITAEGTDIKEYNVDLTTVFVSANDYDNYPVFYVRAQLLGDVQVRKRIFSYFYQDKTYLSDVSKDDAWYEARKTNYDSGNRTEDDVWKEYREYCQSLDFEQNITVSKDEFEIAEFSSSGTKNKSTYVKGHLKWKDSSNNEHPLINAKVALYDQDSVFDDILSETFTDSDGYYEFVFNNPDNWWNLENGGADPYICIYASSNTFDVCGDWAFQFLTSYRYYTEPAENVTTGSTTTFDCTFKAIKNVLIYNAFVLSQGRIYGQRLAHEVGGLDYDSVKSHLKVAYPGLESTGAFSYKGLAGIAKSLFNNWLDVIHEYGHFVEHCFDTYGHDLIDIICFGATHSDTENHFDNGNDKQYRMTLTWTESWAYVFAFICYDVYPEIKASGYAEQIVSEINKYSTFTADKHGGEAQENSVTAYLWNLYKEHLGAQAFWDATVVAGTYTLTDFALNFAKHKEYIDGSGKLMERFQISPTNLKLRNKPDENTPPEFSWIPQGSKKYPNNQFDLVFYSSSGHTLYLTEKIMLPSGVSYTGTRIHRLSQSEWSTILAALGDADSYRVAVRGYQTYKEPVSGPYSSSTIHLDLPIRSLFLSTTSNYRYYEEILSIPAGGSVSCFVTFGQSGYRIFQTFGTLDTILELYDSSNRRISKDDDGGYSENAYRKVSVTANEKYRVRLSCYNFYSSGKVRLAIVPAWGARRHDVTSFETYEDIWQISDYENYTLKTYLTKDYSEEVRYLPPTSGYYTIELESLFDSYLYVIDPRSPDSIPYGDYDDDEVDTGGDASVTKYLEQGVSYLLIVSRFDNSRDFADLDTGDDVLVKIHKNG